MNGASAYAQGNSFGCDGDRDPHLASIWTWRLSRARGPGDLVRA